MPSPSGTQWVTSDDIVNETLKNLGVASAGQNIDPEDYQFVQEKIMPMFQKLANLQVCYVPQLSAIPGAWFDDLAAIMSQACCMKFGANPEDHQRWAALGLGGPPSPVPFLAGTAALSLIQQMRGRPTGEPERAIYF
jgi:hypothetical protein